eukprot:CAMPEP_0201146106 /NCGR_PEP_ID=MMETSP0851-20130426/7810_1 /ASSEMBLY_ACC=CAM_ASM_000631 /TAXON_ID=183588 /ORGANISM="Pseudo-nitzschia fraudulenta, Strain WWA7" /LENGTH=767 /DNA_ID=CAMNT_0047421543 /DNA_START=84 /DNA_END=2387 /DNA_ORIENTATION=-
MTEAPPEIASGVSPKLPFGDINLVVLTDVHSWIGGHGTKEGPSLGASYGDVVSFYQRLKHHCNYGGDAVGGDECSDLWLVQNGDWIDGTGLATDGDPSALIPLIEKMPFDVLNTGNHELYRDSVIEEMRKPGGFLKWWGPRHLASNVYMNHTRSGSEKASLGDKREPMSNRYHVLKGKRSTVLVFGFIYDLPNPSDLVVVQTVREAVQENWFRAALADEQIGYDAILVMLHAGHDDPSVETVRREIRKVTREAGIDEEGNLPIQFVAGHTHYRRYAVADPQSTVVEAGRYLDTVGWVSFPNANTIRKEKETRDRERGLRRIASNPGTADDTEDYSATTNATVSNNATEETISETSTTHRPSVSNDTDGYATVPGTPSGIASTQTTTSGTSTASITDLFHHVFLDASVPALRDALGIRSTGNGGNDDFDTALGKEISSFIKETQESMGLTKKIGCAPRDYPLNRSMAHEDSLWRLYQDHVGPHAVATVELTGDEVPAAAAAASTTGATSVAATSTSSSSSSGSPASNRALFVSQDSWRYGLYGGKHLNRDDIIVVSPFNEPIYRVAVLPCRSMRELNQSMNANQTDLFYDQLPAWVLSATDRSVDDGDGDALCELYVNHFGLSRVRDGFDNIRSDGFAWEPVATNLTTTSIWFSFVADQWQCPDTTDQDYGVSQDSGNLSNPWGMSTDVVNGYAGSIAVKVVVSLLTLCVVVVSCCMIRKGRSNRYNGVVLDGTDNIDNDVQNMLSDAEYTDDDADANTEGEAPVRIV